METFKTNKVSKVYDYLIIPLNLKLLQLWYFSRKFIFNAGYYRVSGGFFKIS